MIKKVTLLKDLPSVKAGFSFSINEETIEKHYQCCNFCGCPEGMNHDDYDKMIHSVLSYREFTDWVKIEPDFSKAIQIQCPQCEGVGMFPYDEKELDETSFGDVTCWYQTVGLECPRCNYKVQTHSICVKKKVSW